MTTVDNKVEIVFSFDTTGSMYPCLTQVRRKIGETVKRLTSEIPGIRIGIVAHGDYCDAGSTYVTKSLDLTSDEKSIVSFVEKVGPTGGGDSPECYELVLHEAKSFSWTNDYTKVFVLIGDDIPHGPNLNPKKLNWRTELEALSNKGISIYGVQCLNRSHATPFYKELSEKSGGFHITLDQFAYVTDMILAVCIKQTGDEKLQSFEKEIKTQGRMNRGLDKMFGSMLKRKPSSDFAETDLHAVPPGRFQVLDVVNNVAIKEFVLENGLTFKTGRGFYEFTKTETIQAKKEIVLMDRKTEDLFTGNRARELLGITSDSSVRLKPSNLEKYIVFVQSTSVNRKLIGGTKFLYEVEDYSS